MRFKHPVEIEILREIADDRRQTSKNLAEIIGEDRNYVNNRVGALSGSGVLERVGPADNSGIYEITDMGHRALRFQDKYAHEHAFEFGQFVKGELSREEFEDRIE